MLIRVRRQDWDASFEYAPPLVDALVNTDDVVTAHICESRGAGPWVKVVLRNGGTLIVEGTLDNLFKS